MGARTVDSYTAFGKKLREQMRKLNNKPHVETGFPVEGDKGKFSDTPYDESDMTVGEVAVFNEFGTSTIPERPFVRAAFDQYHKDMRKFIDKVLAEVVSGKITIAQGMARIGLRHVSQIQAVIDSDVPPPNAPSVILRKMRRGPQNTKFEGTGTLRDSGQMRAAVTYQIFLNGQKES